MEDAYMKLIKPLLLVGLMTTSLLLTSCGCKGKGNNTESSKEPDETEIDTSTLDPDMMNQTFNFFLDYSHSDEDQPYFTMRWWAYTPLGKCPEEAKLTDADATDPLFPHFIGYSRYPSSIDETNLWNFKEDNTVAPIVNLYGIWVAND